MYTFATSLTAEIDKCTWDINIHSGNAHFHVITHYVLSVSSNLQRSLVENFKVHKFYRLAIAVYNLCLLLILSLQLSSVQVLVIMTVLGTVQTGMCVDLECN